MTDKKLVRKKKKIARKNVTKVRKFPWGIVLGIVGIIAVIAAAVGVGINMNMKSADYIVETNAFFAPFEFYEGREITGVDVEIIRRVAEKLGKEIEVRDVEFDVIIDNVEAGKIADAGVAGLTITPARAEKVDFSLPYYTSQQYVIFPADKEMEIRDGHVTWESLAGATLGSQTGGTGYLFASDEAETGVLAGTGTTVKGFDSHQLAADAIAAHIVDYAIADELPAKMIVSRNSGLRTLPLYYLGEDPSDVSQDFPTEEAYAVAVNKNRPELLNAFNEVLTEMLIKDENGMSEIDKLVLKYMGF